jgi:hypothetical protein
VPGGHPIDRVPGEALIARRDHPPFDLGLVDQCN